MLYKLIIFFRKIPNYAIQTFKIKYTNVPTKSSELERNGERIKNLKENNFNSIIRMKHNKN